MTRTLISAWTDGRPPVGRMESLVQLLAEATLLPPQDGVWGHDHEGPSPPGPNPGQPDPEEAIRRAKLGSGRRPPVDGELGFGEGQGWHIVRDEPRSLGRFLALASRC